MQLRNLLAAALTAIIVPTGLSAAAYMQIEGIKGESTARGHEDQIEILSFSWGMSQRGSSAVGQSARAGRPSGDVVIVTKAVDKSSPKLAEAITRSTVLKEVVLADDQKRLKLTNVIISNIESRGDTEELTLRFERLAELPNPRARTMETPAQTERPTDSRAPRDPARR